MASENASPDERTEVNPEDPAASKQPEQPALNRAERRAQAKGKKGTAGANSPLHHTGNLPGGFNRGPGGAGKTRLPRTGHK